MTRHTPNFVRCRDSNMSLRDQMMLASVLGATSIGASVPEIEVPAEAKDLRPEAFTKPYCEFMTNNPTVFHAVGYFKEKLVKSGFKEVCNIPSEAVDIKASVN